MSKFAAILHYLDFDKKKIKPRVFADGVRAINPQEVCNIPLKKVPELSPECKRCRFKVMSWRTGQLNEFGIDGYMSNQKDPFEKTSYEPTAGVKLREPHTIIIGEGTVFRCINRKCTSSEGSVDILHEGIFGCEHMKEEIKPKSEK